MNFRGFDFAFIVCDDGSDRYAVASQIARALPPDIPWLAPDIAVALHRPAVREAISCWLGVGPIERLRRRRGGQ